MATQVFYGGVTIFNATTTRWDQEAVYDESGADLISQKYSLQFTGYVHFQANPLQNSTVYTLAEGGSSAVSIYKNISDQLMQPRGGLRVHFENELVLDVAPMDGFGDKDSDVNNGPKPRNLTIDKVISSSLLKVTFSIDAEVNFCKFEYKGARTVLSNRWGLEETMDANFFITRVVRGTMRVARSRSNLSTTPDSFAHNFKDVVVPGLENGFRREQIAFGVDPDGLTCRYMVTDKQVHHSAPPPATKMSVRHSESTTDGSKYYSTVNVKLEGPPHANKLDLIAQVIAIADVKIQVTNKLDKFIEHLELVDHIGEENIVEGIFRVFALRNQEGEAVTKLQVDTLGKKLELRPIALENQDVEDTYDPLLSPRPYIYGYDPCGARRNVAALFTLHCYLQDPCDPSHAIARDFSEGEEKEDNRDRYGPPDVFEVPSSALTTEEREAYDEINFVGLHTISRMVTRYPKNYMRIQMPIGKRSGGSSTGPTSVIFDLAEPQMSRIIEIDAERVNQPPQIPEPIDTYTERGVMAKISHHDFEPFPPVLSPDGTQLVYRVKASYEYLLDRPTTRSDRLRMPRHALIAGSFYEDAGVEQLTADDYYHDEITP